MDTHSQHTSAPVSVVPMQNPSTSSHRISARSLLLAVIVLMFLSAAVVWVLNALDIIKGPWASILTAVFTVLGVLIGFLQMYAQSSARVSTSASTPQQDITMQPIDMGLVLTEHQGGLFIKANKSLRGATIHLCRGFDISNLKTYIAANVVERQVDHRPVFVAIFPPLKPGNYTVHANSREYFAKVTVSSGQITEVDWR